MEDSYEEHIKELNRRINEMSSDFADMLKDTLSKMQDRIEFANKDTGDDINADVMKKFDNMTNVGIWKVTVKYTNIHNGSYNIRFVKYYIRLSL